MSTLAGDHRACAAILARSGSSFALPIQLLPEAKRRGTTALYALCRVADDLVDDAADAVTAATGLEALAAATEAALAGHTVDDPMLRAVVELHIQPAVKLGEDVVSGGPGLRAKQAQDDLGLARREVAGQPKPQKDPVDQDACLSRPFADPVRGVRQEEHRVVHVRHVRRDVLARRMAREQQRLCVRREVVQEAGGA